MAERGWEGYKGEQRESQCLLKRWRVGLPTVVGAGLDRTACHHGQGMTKKGWTADQREGYCLESDLTLREERWKGNDFDRDVS